MAPFTGSPAALVSVAVGAVRSAVRDSVFDAVLLFPRASVNELAVTLALNRPFAVGVSVNEYEVPDPAKLLTDEFTSVKSADVKLVEDSLKDTLMLIAAFTGSPAALVKVAVGPVRSAVRDSVLDAVLLLPAEEYGRIGVLPLGEEVVVHRVSIVGHLDLDAQAASRLDQMFPVTGVGAGQGGSPVT